MTKFFLDWVRKLKSGYKTIVLSTIQDNLFDKVLNIYLFQVYEEVLYIVIYPDRGIYWDRID